MSLASVPQAPQATRPQKEAQTLGIGALLDLDTAERLLRIGHGRVEVYAMVGETRRFLAEFHPGAVLFGGGSGRLVGLAPDGAELLAVDLPDPPDDPRPQSSALAEAIDNWLRALSEGATRFAPNRPELETLIDGGSASLAPGQAATAGRGLLWFEQEGDPALFLGVATASSKLLPLTPSTWLTAAGRGGRVDARATGALIGRCDWRAEIAAFHTVLGEVLRRRTAVEREAETRRVEAREAMTRDQLTAANERLVGVLTARTQKPVEQADDIAYVLDKITRTKTHREPAASTLGDVFRAAIEARGLRARTVTLEGSWWHADRDLLVGFGKDDGRPVALVPDWRGRYRMYRRGQAPRRITAARAAALDSTAVSIAEPLPDRPVGFGYIAVMAALVCRAEIITIVVAGLAASLLGLLLPLAVGEVIDVFIPDRLTTGVVLLGAALAVLNICASLLQFCTDMARLRIDAKLSTATQVGVMDRVLRLPSRYLKSQSSADLTLRVMAIDQLRRLFTGPVLAALVSGLFGLSSFGLLFYYSAHAAFAAIGLFLVFLVASFSFGLAQLRAATSGEAMTANLASLTLQIVQNVSMLRAFGAERRAFSLWAFNTAAMRSRMLRARLATIGYETFLACYDGLALATVFAFLGYANQADHLSTGSYLAFVAAYQGFLMSSEGLGRAIVQVTGARPMLQRGAKLLAERPESTVSAIDPGALRGEVEVASLSFAYDRDAPLVLNQVSIRAEPGKFIAIAGPSGCGKSTFLNLILGFERPTAGAVLYDGHDLSTLNPAAVRRQIGVVRQSGKLFGGSVFENILGMHDATIDDAWEAAELAGIAADIKAMPMGLHTVLNEGVPTFSGGQVQRMLIARALVGKPKILLLDEATSALDNVTQAAVSASIERLGVTRIVIAHRLSTIRNADTIYFFDRGRVAESGTFAELMRRDRLFAAFASRQSL